MEFEPRHQCIIYEGSPSAKLPILATMIRRTLDEGYRCLYLNSAPMVAGMRSYLAAMGVDVAGEIAKGRLLLSSESPFEGEGFDVDLMLSQLEETLSQALNDGYKGLWASGDMTWEFGPAQDFNKLLEYEWKLETLIRSHAEMCGICQYHRDTLPSEAMRHGLIAHQTIFINETLSLLNPFYLQSELSAEQKAMNREFDEAVAELCRIDLSTRNTELDEL